MRRLLPAGMALLVIPAIAIAGPVATEGNRTLSVKTTWDPVKASTKKGDLRALKLKFDYVAGTTDGSNIPDSKRVEITTGGPIFGFDAFPKCEENAAAEQGDSACPAGSMVGSGKATAEVHPPAGAPSQDITVDVKLYNGKLQTDENGGQLAEPKDGLLVYTEVAGTKVVFPFWALAGNAGIETVASEEDEDPAASRLFALKEVHLTLPKKTIKKGKRTVPFLGAPRKCEKRWTATATSEVYDGPPLTAIHKAKCTKP